MVFTLERAEAATRRLEVDGRAETQKILLVR